MFKKIIFIMLAGLLMCTAAFATACSDDDGDGGEPEATPTESLVPPTVSPNQEMTRFDGQRWPYQIFYPTGWEPRLDGPSLDEWYQVSPSGIDTAHLSVLCGGSIGTGTTRIEDMQADDALILSTTTADEGELIDAEVDGRRAIKWAYRVNFPGTEISAWTSVYYVQGNEGECSYRVKVVAIGAPPVDTYDALLDRIMASFIPDRGSTEG